MINRRDFVLTGLALPTLGLLSSRGAHAAPAADPAAVLAIADWTFDAASAEFADEAARYGIGVRGFDGDVGGLWLHELEPKIAASQVSVVGLSGPGVLFCLETLTRAHGFGAVFRAERPERGAKGWPSVAARYALVAAAEAARGGGTTLAPFEHHFRTSGAEGYLLAWVVARDARRPASRPISRG